MSRPSVTTRSSGAKNAPQTLINGLPVWIPFFTALAWMAAGLPSLTGFYPLISLPTPATPLLETTWNSILSRWNTLTEWSLIPAWMLLIIFAVFVGGAVRRGAAESPLLAGLGAILLILSISPDQVLTLALIAALPKICLTDGDHFRAQSFAIVAWMCACWMVSVDFGWLWLLPGLAWWGVREAPARRLWRGQILAWVIVPFVLAAVSLASGEWAGFAAALARPVSAIWLAPTVDLAPQMAPVFSSMEWLPPDVAGVSALLGGIVLCLSAGPRWSQVLWLAGSIILAMQCRWYLGLTAAVFWYLSPSRETSASRPRWSLMMATGLALIAFVLPSGTWNPSLKTTALLLPSTPDALDPLAWQVQGPVWFCDLNLEPSWRTPAIQQALPPLITSRWDLFGDRYAHYAARTDDMLHLRSDGYLKPDGTIGGYRTVLTDWDPSLLVVPSERLDAIRNLSLSPDWGILGFDGRRACFGRLSQPQSDAARQRAGATLGRLEFPGLSGRSLEPNVIVVEHPDDYTAVARCLVAVRLPFAALRVLRAEPGAVTPAREADCYLELAHRCQRYTGTASLLDHVRLIASLRAAESGASTDDRQRWSRGLKSLGLPESIPEWLEDPSRTSGTSLETRIGGDAVRDWLRRGAPIEEANVLDQRTGAARRFAELLSEAGTMGTAEMLSELRQLAEQSELAPDHQAECWFYVGCLANELGDPPTAATAFANSLSADSGNPFRPLCKLYLQRIRAG